MILATIKLTYFKAQVFNSMAKGIKQVVAHSLPASGNITVYNLIFEQFDT